ncbi:MAG: hypothetical protein SGJ27_09085 [Candidatus Melainabacteria bacterium]|nr:hypothetical protein [Candidatus Melainabacteria bacterium]
MFSKSVDHFASADLFVWFSNWMIVFAAAIISVLDFNVQKHNDRDTIDSGIVVIATACVMLD